MTHLSTQLAFGNLVSGASAEGHGVITDWYGRGDRTREQLIDVATVAEIPREWLPPVKDARVQLSRACAQVAGNAYRVRPVRKTLVGPDATDTERQEHARANAWTGRYSMARLADGRDLRAGEADGTTVLVVTLWETEDASPRLAFEGAPGEQTDALITAVREQFERRIAQERYVAADVTKWLGDLLRRRLGAVKLGRAWYIPRETKTVAEGLVDALRTSGWGHSWLYPPLPVATTAQLSMGLALGLQDELTGIMHDLDMARKTARDAGRADIGPRAVDSFTRRVNEVDERVTRHRALLGDDNVSNCKALIGDALVLLDGINETFEVEAA